MIETRLARQLLDLNSMSLTRVLQDAGYASWVISAECLGVNEDGKIVYRVTDPEVTGAFNVYLAYDEDEKQIVADY